MHIGINAIGTRHSGAATVLLSMVNGLLESPEVERLTLFLSPRSERRYEIRESARCRIVEAPASTNHPIARYAWLRTQFAEWIGRAGCTVILNMNNVAGRSPVPQALFIQQSRYFSREAVQSYTRYLGLSGLVEAAGMRMIMRQSVKLSDVVVVQTHHMANSVAENLEEHADVRVIYPTIQNFTSPHSHLLSVRSSEPPRFLYVGNASPYKNLRVIRKAADIARQRRHPWTFALTIDTPDSSYSPNIEYLGHIDSGNLYLQYSSATALIMPSLVETVGLPMLEAMRLRRPVVAADRPYARELCGDAAMYFDPHDASTLYACLQSVEDPITNSAMSKRAAENLMKFPDQGEHGKKWIALLREIAR